MGGLLLLPLIQSIYPLFGSMVRAASQFGVGHPLANA